MSPWKLRQAVRLIHLGGVIAYPTETVYGLGCDPLNHDAVLHLCRLKQRQIDKGLILIADTVEQIMPYVSVSHDALKPLTRKQPQPTSWIVPASDHCPEWLRGHHPGIVIRLSSHPLARQLCRLSGRPLVSTSANISKRPAARNPPAIHRIFSGQLDMIIHEPCGHLATHSLIRDLQTRKIIRPTDS